MKRNRSRGFTLAELLVVVAIIGVLVAIAIPTFTGQLKKARIAVDDANVRSAYSLFLASQLTYVVPMSDGTQMELAPDLSGSLQTTYDLYLAEGCTLTMNPNSSDVYILQETDPDCPLHQMFPDFVHEKGKKLYIKVILNTKTGNTWTIKTV